MAAMGQRWWSESIDVGFFHKCLVSDDKIELTLPPIYGFGFLFDGVRRVVTIRLRLLWRTKTREIPFQDASLRVSERFMRGGPDSPDWTHYEIKLVVADDEPYTVFRTDGSADKKEARKEAFDILAPFRKLGLKTHVKREAK